MKWKFDAQKQLITAIPDWMFAVITITFMMGCFAAGIQQSSVSMIFAILAGLSFVHAFCFIEKYQYDESPPLNPQLIFYAMASILCFIMLQISSAFSAPRYATLWSLCVSASYVVLFMVNLVIVLTMKSIYTYFSSTGTYES